MTGLLSYDHMLRGGGASLPKMEFKNIDDFLGPWNMICS